MRSKTKSHTNIQIKSEMAKSEDIILRTIWDDTEAVNGISSLIKNMDKAEAAFTEMTAESEKSAKAIGKQLVEANQKAGKEIDNVTKSVVNQTKANEAQKKAIQDVAKAIITGNDGAAKFAALMERVEKVRLTGAVNDIQDLEKEFEELISAVRLTDDQIRILESNIEGVAGEIAAIAPEKLQEIANDAEKMTGEFVTAKRELRLLTNLINSGQLTGEELVKAEQRAAELTDTIGDVQTKLKLLASDTRGLDLMVESFTAVGAGAQVFEGAMALAGDESEEFQETLIRLNAVMAIANGLQQAGTILTTKGGIATQFATGAQKAYNLVVGTSSGVMKAFRIALASTGIGLLVIGLGVLIANFDKVKKAVTDFIPGLNQIGSVFEGLKNSISSFFSDFGSVFASLFSGDFSEAYEQFKNIGSNAREAFDEGFGANEAQKQKDIIAKDLENLAKAQRRRAEILQAGGKETQKIIENATANELAALKLRNASQEEIEDKAHELRIKQAERQKKLEDERIKTIEDFKKRFAATVKEIGSLYFELGGLSEQEKFDIVKEQTLTQFKKLREELIKTGRALGKDYAGELEKIDTLIQGLSEREYVPETIQSLPKTAEKALKDTKKIISQNPVTIPPPKFATGGEPELRSEFEKLFERVFDDVTGIEDILANAFEEIFKSLPDGAGKEFIAGATALVGEFSSILNEATDIELNNLDKQIDRLSERREKLQDELEKELELQEQGLANNVGLKQQEVDGLLAEEDRLLKRREEMQKAAQRRQLAAETVSQTASLTTSSIDIIKGFSKIPIIGLGLGIAAVASLFGFFAATKAKAFQATRLYTGAKSIDDHFGTVAGNGRSDIPGRGEGYRVIDAVTGQDTNVRISGREMLLPESVTESQREFFNALLNGDYNGVDIAGVLSLHRSNKQAVNSKGVAAVVNNTVVNVPKRQYITYVPTTGKNKGKTVARLVDIPEKDDHVIILES